MLQEGMVLYAQGNAQKTVSANDVKDLLEHAHLDVLQGGLEANVKLVLTGILECYVTSDVIVNTDLVIDTQVFV